MRFFRSVRSCFCAITALLALVVTVAAEQQPPWNTQPAEPWAVFDTCRYLMVRHGVNPPRALYTPSPSFDVPRSALRQGTMQFTVAISKEGLVEAVRVRQSLAPQMDEAAAQALMQWKFSPPLSNGVPVGIQEPIEVEYREDGYPLDSGRPNR